MARLRFTHLSLKQLFVRTFATLMIVFLILGGLCGHFLLSIHSTLHEKSQTEALLQHNVNKMELQILNLVRSLGAYLSVSSASNKEALNQGKQRFLESVRHYESLSWAKSQYEETSQLVAWSKLLQIEVDRMIVLQSDINLIFIGVEKLKNQLWQSLAEEKSRLRGGEELYTETLKQILRLEKYVQTIDSLIAPNFIKEDKTFYEEIYDLERDYRAIFQAQEGAVTTFSHEGFFNIFNEFSAMINVSYKLIKFRESRTSLMEDLQKLSSQILALLNDRILLMLSDRNVVVQKIIDERLLKLSLLFLILIVAMFILGSLFYVVFMRMVVNPLLELTHRMHMTSSLNDVEHASLNEQGCLETQDLYYSFGYMIRTIREQESLLKNSIENMEESFVLAQIKTDEHCFAVVDCNPSAEEMFRMNKTDIVGQDLVEIFPWFSEHSLIERAWIVFHSGTASSFDKVTLVVDEREQFIELTIYKVEDGVALLARDVTARLMMEKHLLHSEKLVAVGEMAAGVAHEIGNPLTAVSSIVQILSKQEDDPQKQKDLTIVYQNIQRIQDALQNIVDYSRKPKQEKTIFSVHETLDHVEELMQYHKKLKDVDLIMRKDAAKSLICADSKDIEQVLLNILVNAADAIEERRQKEFNLRGSITLMTQNDSTHCNISIFDNGIGLDCREIKKIFEPFFTTKKKVEGSGTGLGMTIVKNTVERYDGRVEIFSDKGHGTRVVLSFPLQSF